MNTQIVIDFVREFGFPTLCVAMLAWGCWRVLVWVGRELVLPIRDGIVSHFKNLDATLQEIAVLLRAIKCRYPAVLEPHGNGDSRTTLEAIHSAHGGEP